MTKRQSQLWLPTFTPSAMRWWFESISGARDYEPYRGTPASTYSHFGALLDCIDGGRSANEAEGLDQCFRRVVDGNGRSRTGLWCVCLTEAPSAGEARGSIGGDSTAGLLAIKADLQHAVDQVPISWAVTPGLYLVQGRELLYQARYRRWLRGESQRSVDREPEPRDPDTGRPIGRSYAWYLMSYWLTCTPDSDGLFWAWPRRDEVDSGTFLTMITTLPKMPRAA